MEALVLAGERKGNQETYIISPYLWVAMDLGNIDQNFVFWGHGVFSITNRGGFLSGDGSSGSRRPKSKGFPHNCERVGHMGQILQGNLSVPQHLINLSPQLEENLRMF